MANKITSITVSLLLLVLLLGVTFQPGDCFIDRILRERARMTAEQILRVYPDLIVEYRGNMPYNNGLYQNQNGFQQSNGLMNNNPYNNGLNNGNNLNNYNNNNNNQPMNV